MSMVRVKNFLFDKLAILLFLVIWEFVTRANLVNTMLFPPFSKVILAIGQLLSSGQLVTHSIISLERSIGGFLLAAVLAVPLGLIMGGWFRSLETAIKPLFEIAAQVNPFILFHVIILFLGIGEAAKITIIAWVCIWPILFNTASGIRNADSTLLKAGLSFGLSRFTVFYKIVLPAAAPAIFTGLRLSAGYSFFLLIAAEMMGANSGLGWFVLYSQENYNIEWIFAGATVIAILGVTIDLILKGAQKKLIIWETE